MKEDAVSSEAKNGMHTYQIIRSARRTVALELTREGHFVVRAPNRMKDADILRFVSKHRAWMEKAWGRFAERQAAAPPNVEVLREKAHRMLPPLVDKYAKHMGVAPTGVTVTAARTRFGSCSPKNRLCFSLYLMQYPNRAIEYVVVHELAHILHKNHSAAFHATVAAVLPDHLQRRALLRLAPTSND